MAPMTQPLLIALGGALGSLLRSAMAFAVPGPGATITVNVAGSLAMGWLFSALGQGPWAPFLLTGLLGGFTTFSAFSLDALRLLEAGRAGAAMAYVAASVGVSLAACWAGLALGRPA